MDAWQQPWLNQIRDFALVGERAVSRGLVLASAGNMSARDPETGHMLVTASGTFLDELDTDAFSLMDERGLHIAGPSPSSEWRLHHETYLERPDAAVIVHMHPEFTVLLDSIDVPIRQHTLDHVAYVPRIARVPFAPNGSSELAVSAAQAMRDTDCVILGRHGCSVIGATARDAYRRVLNLEQAASMTYRLELLNRRDSEFPEALRATAIHA